MKVILLKDVENIGKKFEVKEVKSGYARNFLLPNNLAKIATEEAIATLEAQKEVLEKKAEEELKLTQEMASKIDGLEVMISVKIGDKDQLFEKINSQKIADKLKEMGFDVKKSQIEIEKPIQELGEFPVKVRFSHNLESVITLIVSEKNA